MSQVWSFVAQYFEFCLFISRGLSINIASPIVVLLDDLKHLELPIDVALLIDVIVSVVEDCDQQIEQKDICEQHVECLQDESKDRFVIVWAGLVRPRSLNSHF